MKDYFELKTFITVILALIVFAILDRLFLSNLFDKLLKKGDFEKENLDDENDDDDDDDDE